MATASMIKDYHQQYIDNLQRFERAFALSEAGEFGNVTPEKEARLLVELKAILLKMEEAYLWMEVNSPELAKTLPASL